MFISYLGPGIGLGSIILVLLVLLLVIIALGVVLWMPIRRFFRKLFSK